MDISIKKYTGTKAEDLNLKGFIKDLWQYLVAIDRWNYRILSKKYVETELRKIKSKIKNNSGIVYFAQIDNVPVGYIFAYLKDLQKDNSHKYKSTIVCSIDDFYVSEKFRKQGLGKKLLEKLFQSYKNKCSYFIISAFGSNRNAYKFYKKMGFQELMHEMIIASK